MFITCLSSVVLRSIIFNMTNEVFKLKVKEFLLKGNKFTLNTMARYLNCSKASIRYHLKCLDVSVQSILQDGDKALIKSSNKPLSDLEMMRGDIKYMSEQIETLNKRFVSLLSKLNY